MLEGYQIKRAYHLQRFGASCGTPKGEKMQCLQVKTPLVFVAIRSPERSTIDYVI